MPSTSPHSSRQLKLHDFSQIPLCFNTPTLLPQSDLEARRGWRIISQVLSLRPDFDTRSLTGVAWLTFQAVAPPHKATGGNNNHNQNHNADSKAAADGDGFGSGWGFHGHERKDIETEDIGHKYITHVPLNMRRLNVSSCHVSGIDTNWELRCSSSNSNNSGGAASAANALDGLYGTKIGHGNANAEATVVGSADDPRLCEALEQEAIVRPRIEDIEADMSKRLVEGDAGEVIVEIPQGIQLALREYIEAARHVKEYQEVQEAFRMGADDDDLNYYSDHDPNLRSSHHESEDQNAMLFKVYQNTKKTGCFTIQIQYTTQHQSNSASLIWKNEPENLVATCSEFGLARTIFPCIDNFVSTDSCPFTINIEVSPEMVALASGDLVEVVLVDGENLNEDEPDLLSEDSYNSDNDEKRNPKKIYRYVCETPVHPCNIGFVVAPFKILPDPVHSKTITHFCLHGKVRHMVRIAPSLLEHSLGFFSENFGVNVKQCSFKQVFIPLPGLKKNPKVYAGGLLLFCDELLQDTSDIDVVYDTKFDISLGLSRSFFGNYVFPHKLEDVWLVVGIAEFISLHALRTSLGTNWFKTTIMNEMDMLAKEWDCGGVLGGLHRESSMADIATVHTKSSRRRACLLVYMMEKRIGGNMFRRALRDIITEAMIKRTEPAVTIHEGSYLGVALFLKRLRALCGNDLRSFVKQWISCSAFPIFHCGYRYDPRRHQLEFAIKQELKWSSLKSKLGFAQGFENFTGTLTVRIMEFEGPHDHQIELREGIMITELPCHSKRTKQKASAQSESQKNDNNNSPILFVRVDPEQEWVKQLHFKQSDSSWVSQFKQERDSIAQIESCIGLRKTDSEEAISMLTSALADSKLYYRVRLEAAKTLLCCTGKNEEYLGIKAVVSFIEEKFMTQSKISGKFERDMNDFSDFTSYFMLKGLIGCAAFAMKNFYVTAVGTRNPEKKEIPKAMIDFLDLIFRMWTENDNRSNYFIDDYLIEEFLKTLGAVGLSSSVPESLKILFQDQLSIYLVEERLIRDKKHYRGIIHSTALDILSTLSTFGTFFDLIPREKVTEEINYGILSDNFQVKVSALRAALCVFGVECFDFVLAFGMTNNQSSKHRLSHLESGAERNFIMEMITQHIRERHDVKEKLWERSDISMAVCLKILQLLVSEMHPSVRLTVIELARSIWGRGIPVCLLTDHEYLDMKREQKVQADKADKVELKVNLNTDGMEAHVITQARRTKVKPPKHLERDETGGSDLSLAAMDRIERKKIKIVINPGPEQITKTLVGKEKKQRIRAHLETPPPVVVEPKEMVEKTPRMKKSYTVLIGEEKVSAEDAFYLWNAWELLKAGEPVPEFVEHLEPGDIQRHLFGIPKKKRKKRSRNSENVVVEDEDRDENHSDGSDGGEDHGGIEKEEAPLKIRVKFASAELDNFEKDDDDFEDENIGWE